VFFAVLTCASLHLSHGKHLAHKRTRPLQGCGVRYYLPIVLQKSKVAGLRIFRENTERKTIADSYDLNRVTEVACEFNVRR